MTSGQKWPGDSSGEDAFELRLGRGARGATSGKVSGRLTKHLSGRRVGAKSSIGRAHSPMNGDGRQRVIVKVAFRSHGRGGGGGAGGGRGGALHAHGRYLERDGAGREGERGQFFDRDVAAVEDARERLSLWERDDPRHFRLMLAPESGARIDDLAVWTREVMAGMEKDLGVRLDWMAVAHHNTDNPHVHVILRGVREDGRDLVIARDYMARGLRERAREVTTEHLGPRGIEDARLSRQREVDAPHRTRLDRVLERSIDRHGDILLQRLGRDHETPRAPGMGGEGFGDALRARARALEARGLAREVRRNVLRFERDWLARLPEPSALDVSRTLRTSRLYERGWGTVRGVVQDLGSRGADPERGLLIVETDTRGRVLLNTTREALDGLQKGATVTLHPEGRRASIERIAFHPVKDQARALADTALDRDLDAIARGEERRLPQLPAIERALEERVAYLMDAGLGHRDPGGRFVFRDGVRDALRAAELARAGRDLAKAEDRDIDAPEHTQADGWRLRDTRELFAGRAAVLERGDALTLAALSPDNGRTPEPGDTFRLERSRSSPAVEAVQEIARSRSAGRDRDVGRDR